MEDKEIECLETLGNIAKYVHKINQTLDTMNKYTMNLVDQMHELETKLNAVYIPFQSAIYEYSLQEQRRLEIEMNTEKQAIMIRNNNNVLLDEYKN